MPNKYKKGVRRKSKEVCEEFSAAAAINNLSDNNESAADSADNLMRIDIENECLIDNNSESDYLEENEGLEYVIKQFNIKDELAKWSVKHLISHCALNDLLGILRTLEPNLPKDARTLKKKTPRDAPVVPIKEIAHESKEHIAIQK